MDDVWRRFKDLVFTAADQCILKVRLSRRKRVHWLSAKILQQMRKKRRQYKKAKQSSKQEDIAHYKRTSNAGLPAKTTVITWKTCLNNWSLINGSFGGGSKMSEVVLLVLPT